MTFDDYGNALDLGNSGSDTLGFDPENPYPDTSWPDDSVPGGGMPDTSGLMGLVKQYGPAVAKELWGAVKRGAPAAIGAIGANQQANSLAGLAEKYMALGAPSRARYEASYAPGFTMANDPGYKDALDQTTKATLHGLSVGGNPAGSPNAWTQTLSDVNSKFAYPALQDYRRTNVGAGGLAALTSAAPGAATGAINAQGNVFSALGAGAADIFNPPRSLADVMAEMKRAGY